MNTPKYKSIARKEDTPNMAKAKQTLLLLQRAIDGDHLIHNHDYLIRLCGELQRSLMLEELSHTPKEHSRGVCCVSEWR